VPPAARNYVLDACALIAYFDDEEGADVVEGLFEQARNDEITLTINAANLIEVYYDQIRKTSTERADVVIQDIYATFPITVIETLNPDIVREAAYLKTAGKISFADTILVATAVCTDATIVTCDHIELEPVEQQEHIPFLWIRPQF